MVINNDGCYLVQLLCLFFIIWFGFWRETIANNSRRSSICENYHVLKWQCEENSHCSQLLIAYFLKRLCQNSCLRKCPIYSISLITNLQHQTLLSYCSGITIFSLSWVPQELHFQVTIRVEICRASNLQAKCYFFLHWTNLSKSTLL